MVCNALTLITSSALTFTDIRAANSLLDATIAAAQDVSNDESDFESAKARETKPDTPERSSKHGTVDVELRILIHNAINMLRTAMVNKVQQQGMAHKPRGRPKKDGGLRSAIEADRFAVSSLEAVAKSSAINVNRFMSAQHANLLWNLYTSLLWLVTPSDSRLPQHQVLQPTMSSPNIYQPHRMSTQAPLDPRFQPNPQYPTTHNMSQQHGLQPFLQAQDPSGHEQRHSQAQAVDLHGHHQDHHHHRYHPLQHEQLQPSYAHSPPLTHAHPVPHHHYHHHHYRHHHHHSIHMSQGGLPSLPHSPRRSLSGLSDTARCPQPGHSQRHVASISLDGIGPGLGRRSSGTRSSLEQNSQPMATISTLHNPLNHEPLSNNRTKPTGRVSVTHQSPSHVLMSVHGPGFHGNSPDLHQSHLREISPRRSHVLPQVSPLSFRRGDHPHDNCDGYNDERPVHRVPRLHSTLRNEHRHSRSYQAKPYNVHELGDTRIDYAHSSISHEGIERGERALHHGHPHAYGVTPYNEPAHPRQRSFQEEYSQRPLSRDSVVQQIRASREQVPNVDDQIWSQRDDRLHERPYHRDLTEHEPTMSRVQPVRRQFARDDDQRFRDERRPSEIPFSRDSAGPMHRSREGHDHNQAGRASLPMPGPDRSPPGRQSLPSIGMPGGPGGPPLPPDMTIGSSTKKRL